MKQNNYFISQNNEGRQIQVNTQWRLDKIVTETF